MATPIVEQIAQELLERLEEITVANTFQYTLTAGRPNRKGLSNSARPKDSTALLQTKAKTLNKENSAAGNPRLLAWDQNFVVDVFGYEDDDETESVETRLSKMGADVEKKIMEDPQRNSLAMDTFLNGSIIIIDPEWSGIEVMFMVRFRVREDDPYTQA